MKINIKRIFLLLFFFELYVVICSMLFDYNIDQIIFSIIHSFLAVITTYCIINAFDPLLHHARPSLGLMSLFTLNSYFVLSIIKYGREPMYSGFPSDLSVRFLGTFFCFISLMLSCYLIRKFQQSHVNTDNFRYIHMSNTLVVLGMFFICFVLLYDAISTGNYYNGNREWNSPIEAFLVILKNSIFYILVAISVYKINAGRNKILLLPIFAYLVTAVLISVISGSRTTVIIPFVSVLYCLLLFNKLTVKGLTWITCLNPFGIILLSLFIFLISGRDMDLNFDTLSRNLTYRFDLSDFSMTTMLNTGFFKVDFSTFLDGIKQALPSILLPDNFKQGLDSYSIMLSSNGLNPWFDYTDTYFSMGSELFGLPGMILIPVAIILFFEKIDYLIDKNFDLSVLLKASLCSYVIVIERAWLDMIPLLRSMIVCFFVSYIIVLLCFKLASRRT